MLALRRSGMARRRFQTGQLIDGGDRWEARWREDVIVGGEVRRVRRWDVLCSKKECPTRRLAQRKLDEKLRSINHEDYKPTVGETFGKFADRWMKTVLIYDKPSTQRSDTSVINVHLLPAFKDLSFKDITAELLQVWVSQQKVSAKSVCNFVAVMRRMWAKAIEWGYVTSNPIESLKLPTFAKGHAYTFSVEETLGIISAAKGWKKVFFRVLAETGIRPGELAGLRREDVKGRVVFVRQSVWQRQVQTPKTKTAIRKFVLSVDLAETLQRHIDESPVNAFGLVFAAESGRPLSMDNFRHRTLNPILEKLGIRAKIEAAGVRGGNYAFRHMNATLMDELAVPLKTRQSRLGHADPSVTLTHYTAAVDANDLAAADQIGALLAPKKEEEAVQ